MASRWTKAAAAVMAALVLVPASVMAQGGNDLGKVLEGQANLTTFLGLYKANQAFFTNLPSEGVTIIAPNDAAFRKLQSFNTKDAAAFKELLAYHTLPSRLALGAIKPGDTLFASTSLTDPRLANVTKGQNVIVTKQPGGEVVITSGQASRTTVLAADLSFGSNSLVHVVDSVMVTPASLDKTGRDAYTDLASFVGALYHTSLLDEFASQKDVTLFVPRTAAFQLLAGTLDKLDVPALQKILRYHLVPGKVVPNAQLANGTTLKTAGGADVRITRFNNNIYVDAAQVVQTDILIANGVVQMLDNVLDPGKADAAPDTSLPTQAPVFTPVAGKSATGSDAPTPFTSALPCTADCAVPTTKSVRSSTSSGGGAAARCTGLARVVGAGAGVAGGIWGLGYVV